ncbi:MAG: nicotinate-nucleotide adenylyltransferase [Candidatus Eiseniibacteriota bacterium]
MRRIGLFGGTFDPPHLGHLALAECARDQLGLESVLFVPAGTPPHKRRVGRSSAQRRVAMTRLAVRGNRSFRVSLAEVRRHGPSFTVDTLRDMGQRFPGSALYLLMGADSLADFANWHDPREILRLATLVVAARPGVRRRAGPRRGVVWLENFAVDISSSAIRARARSGRSVRYLVPEAVAHYIARHRVYGGAR